MARPHLGTSYPRELYEWAEELEIKYSTLRGRYYTTGGQDLASCIRSESD